MSFPHFDGSISSVKDGRTKVRSILLLWSFMTKSIFRSALRSNAWTKSHLKIFFLLTCFHQMLPCHHPRRPRGSQSGQEKRRHESFQVRAEDPLGTHSHQTISKDSSRCRLLIGHKKCFVLLCPIGEQSLLSSFREFVHDYYCRDHGLSGSCIKEMHAVRKLSVWCKIPIWFRNTVCPKTKDTLPNIQVWAYKRYSRLNRSRI